MKILFLEDRPDRQLNHLPHKEDAKEIESFSVLFMPKSDECKTIFKQINNGEYSFDNDLKIIIAHKSSLDTKGLEHINRFCKANMVKLICFSGGISQITYNNEEYEFLNINSAEFYTERLIPFIKHSINNNFETTLLEIVYKDWKLSYMCLARQIIENLKLERNDSARNEFEVKLEKINSILKFDFTVNSETIQELNKEITKRILLV